MNAYSPELTLRDARTQYFAVNNFGCVKDMVKCQRTAQQVIGREAKTATLFLG